MRSRGVVGAMACNGEVSDPVEEGCGARGRLRVPLAAVRWSSEPRHGVEGWLRMVQNFSAALPQRRARRQKSPSLLEKRA